MVCRERGDKELLYYSGVVEWFAEKGGIESFYITQGW